MTKINTDRNIKSITFDKTTTMKNLLFIALIILISFKLNAQKHLMYDFYYYTNPESVAKTYKNILVISTMDNTTNKRIKRVGRNMNYKLTFFEDVFPPIRKYTNNEITNTCEKMGIDAIIYYTYLGSTAGSTSVETYGNIFIPPSGGVGSVSSTTRTKTSKFIEMDISFVKFTNRNDKLFYVTGGYGPQYSVNVGVELFRKTLQNLKKKNIAIPLSDEEMKAFAEQDEVNEKLQEEQNLKRQEYAKYEETGRINLEKKNYNEAIADFNKVLEIDPNNKIAYFNRARAKSGLGDSKGSIEDNNKVIELDPSYSMAYNNRGWDNFLLKNYIEALKDFNNAIELEPRNAVAYDSRQETKFALNDFAGCMEDCNMAISLNPKLANSYFFRGKVYFKNGDKTKACENWSKAGQYGTMEAYELIKQNCN